MTEADMTGHGAAGDARITGTLRSDGGVGVVRMQGTYPTGIDDLWSAVTDPERLGRWIGEVEGDLRPGGEFRATFTSGWAGRGRVESCEPPSRLRVRLDPGTDDETVVEAELVPDGDHTLLVVEERGFPLDQLPTYGAGWQAHVEDLAAHVAGVQAPDWSARWHELIPDYRQRGVATA